MPIPPTPPSRPSAGLQADQLVRELQAMRDALVQLSLTLRDWQFEVDQAARAQAQQLAQAALHPHRLQQCPPEKQPKP